MKKGRKGRLKESLPKKSTERKIVNPENLISKIMREKKFGINEYEDEDEMIDDLMEDIEEDFDLYDENFLELLKKTIKINKGK